MVFKGTKIKSYLRCIKVNDDVKVKRLFGLPIFGVLALVGGVLVMLANGSFYSFGNMTTYMTSYMRQHGHPNLNYSDFVVVQSTFGMTQGAMMPLLGYINLKIGERTSFLLGGTLYGLGCALTYFTIQKSLWMVALTYGFMSSVGENLSIIPTLTTAIKWFPKHKGLAAGIIVGGYGGGSLIFNQVQTRYINPENFVIESSGLNKGYFTNAVLLDRLPSLLILLGAIYMLMGIVGGLLIFQPPEDWWSDVNEISFNSISNSWKDILKKKEFYLLWLSRFGLTLCTLVIGGFYKTFGLTFIFDDHFLSLVGTICSLFNCAGRIFYGFLMDKLTYKDAMSIETVILTILIATLYSSSIIGNPRKSGCSYYTGIVGSNSTSLFVDSEMCEASPETPLISKVLFSTWIWAIYFTFPGTYSMQPAVCAQTFGQKYGGIAYSFIFTSDIFNNLLVATLSKPLIEAAGFLGLFLSTSTFGILAFILTQFYPKYPGQSREAEPFSVN